MAQIGPWKACEKERAEVFQSDPQDGRKKSVLNPRADLDEPSEECEGTYEEA